MGDCECWFCQQQWARLMTSPAVPELTPDDLVCIVEGRPSDRPSTGCPRCSPDSTESLRQWAEYIDVEV